MTYYKPIKGICAYCKRESVYQLLFKYGGKWCCNECKDKYFTRKSWWERRGRLRGNLQLLKEEDKNE